MEPVDGLEPPTCSLQVSCSSSWAIPAYSRLFFLVRQFKRLFQNMNCCMSLITKKYIQYFFNLYLYYTKFFLKSQRVEKIPYQNQVKPTLCALRFTVSPHTTNLSRIWVLLTRIAKRKRASYHRLSFFLIRNFPLKINLFAFSSHYLSIGLFHWALLQSIVRFCAFNHISVASLYQLSLPNLTYPFRDRDVWT